MEGPEERVGPKWAVILQGLTASRSSIVTAAEFALARPGSADELLAAVVARTQSCPPQQRLTSLYLVDAICSRCASSTGDAAAERGRLLGVTCKWVPTILRHIAGGGETGDYGDDERGGTDDGDDHDALCRKGIG